MGCHFAFLIVSVVLLLKTVGVASQVVDVGTLPNEQHGIGGTLQLINETRIRLKGFSYDGGGPAAYLYYFAPGATVITGQGTIIPYSAGDNRGAFRFGVRFSNEDVTFNLPSDTDACDIGTFTIWCAAARSFFTRLVFPRSLFVGNGADPCALVAHATTMASTTMAPTTMATTTMTPKASEVVSSVGPTDSSTTEAEATTIIPTQTAPITTLGFETTSPSTGVSSESSQTSEVVSSVGPTDSSTTEAEATTIMPTQTAPIEVGMLPTLEHGVSGRLIFLSTTRVRIESFSYDGAGPDAYLYFYSSGANVSPNGGGTFIKLPTSNGGNNKGAFQQGVRYTNQDFTFDLQNGTDVCDIATFTIWCRLARSFFTRLEIPRTLFENNGADPCTLRGVTPVTTTRPGFSGQYENCEVLDSSLQLRWTVDRLQEKIHFMLSGCQSKNVKVAQYMGFGLSGSTSSTNMDGADVTIAWVGNDGQPNAVDYFLQSRTQCRRGEGVCPDSVSARGTCVDNVEAVSGKNINRQQRVSFTRPFRTSDSACDLDFSVDSEQYIVWAIGGVAETAFRHNFRSSSNTRPLRFGRSATNNCGSMEITCDSCAAFPSERIMSSKSGTMFTARIGPSGNDRGYTAITNQVGWGIAWYINDTLVPELYVVRNTTYYFLVEGGNNPDDSSNYHPFYITSSSEGGRLLNTPEQRQNETVYAGFNSNGEPTGVGRLCKSVETQNSFVVLERCGSFQEFRETLSSSCALGQPALIKWTPDVNTPDLVYYQCATHLNLGWKIHVVNNLPEEEVSTASAPPISTNHNLLLVLNALVVVVASIIS